MQVNLHIGKGFISSAIRWQTRSPFSHASMTFSDGVVIESREFIGVHKLPKLVNRPGERINVYEVPQAASFEKFIRDYAELQVGKPYDYISIARFLTREPVKGWQMNDWFCSELVAWCFQQGGCKLLNTIQPWAVNPGMLSLSTLLNYSHTIAS